MKKALSTRIRMSVDKFVDVSLEDGEETLIHLEILNPTNVANAQGGEHRRRVIVGVYPMVAHNVGKKILNDSEITMLVSATQSHQTFQSESANINPPACPCVSPISPSSTKPSSFIRNRASASSSGVSHGDGDEGKSGNMKIALKATTTVSVPSI